MIVFIEKIIVEIPEAILVSRIIIPCAFRLLHPQLIALTQPHPVRQVIILIYVIRIVADGVISLTRVRKIDAYFVTDADIKAPPV